jgi:hypothetical protein
VKFLGFFLSLLLIVQQSCYQRGYAADGINTSVPVNKIGTLLLADATAILTSTTIEVTTKGPDGNQQTALKGQLLNATTAGGTIKAIAYFTGGTQFSNLCTGGPGRVKTASGDVVEGAISNVSAEGLTCGGQRIASSDLKCVDSPCAFEMTASSSKISFKHCTVAAAAEKPTKVKSVGEHQTAKRVLVVVALLAIVAVAVAVPVAVACSNRHHHRTQQPVFFPTQSSSPAPSQPVNDSRSSSSNSSSSR